MKSFLIYLSLCVLLFAQQGQAQRPDFGAAQDEQALYAFVESYRLPRDAKGEIEQTLVAQDLRSYLQASQKQEASTLDSLFAQVLFRELGKEGHLEWNSLLHLDLKEVFVRAMHLINYLGQLAEDANLYQAAALYYRAAQQYAYHAFVHSEVAASSEKLEQLLAKMQAKEDSSLYFNEIELAQDLANYHFGNRRDLEKALYFSNIVEQRSRDAGLVPAPMQRFLLVDIYQAKGDWERAKYYSDLLLKESEELDFRSFAQYFFQYAYYKELGKKKQQRQLARVIDSLYQSTELRNNYFITKKYVEIARDFPEIFNFFDFETLNLSYLKSAIDYYLQHGQSRSSEILEEIIKQFDEQLANPEYYLPTFYEEQAAIGRLRKKQGRYQEALQRYQSALLYLGLDKDAENLEQRIAKLGDDRAAFAIYSDILRIGRLAPELLQQNEQEQALQAALSLSNRILRSYTTKRSKELMLNRLPELYEQALDWQWQKYQAEQNSLQLEEAYQLAERSKSILLSEALQANRAGTDGDLPDSLYQYGAQLQRDIRRFLVEQEKYRLQGNSKEEELYSSRLFEANKALEDYKKLLKSSYLRYYKQHYEPGFVELTDLQAALKQEEQVLLNYVLGEKHIYIFFLDGEQIHWLRKEKDTSFEQRAERLRSIVSTPPFEQKDKAQVFRDFCEEARALYQQLLEQALSLGAEEKKRVLIIPDGILHYLPFEVFLYEPYEEPEQSYSDLPYLIRKYSLSYHYSSALWLDKIQEPQPRYSGLGILGFAPYYQENDSNVIRKHLSNLAGAHAELRYLEQKFRGDYYYNEEAQEALFKSKAENYPILHLAMHGLINYSKPLYSALAFSSPTDSAEDGFLAGYEIEQMKLPAELSVLSACETAYGRYQSGEGILSLGRYFLYAGSASVLLTWWPVNDKTGEWLMRRFYDKLALEMPKDQALQEAKLDFLDRADPIAAHPYYWASYQFLGDSRSINLDQPTGWTYSLLLLAVLILGFVAYWYLKRKSS